MTDKLPTFVDDGLITEEIGPWGEEKYRHLSLYAQMFAASMKKKWDCRVYIDLFAGAGRSRIKGTNRIVAASPLIALAIEPKFDKYILCEKDKQKIRTLETRVKRDNPTVDAIFLPGDVNTLAGQILANIPQHRRDFKVLCFCFVDPYNLKDLAFETIVTLSARFMDFLVLIASDMDAVRNVSTYELPHSRTVERFLGEPEWRSEWKQAKARGERFDFYLMSRFSSQMESLKYIRASIEETKQVRSTEKNLPLYRLALFSRHPRAKEFWQQAMKYGKDQLDLPGL